MDRLPRDVAAERLHHDIVRLLDEHVTMSPQVGGGLPCLGGLGWAELGGIDEIGLCGG